MMDSFSDLADGSRYFDALEQISPALEFANECPGYENWEYDVWISSPQSVDERRRKFIRWIGLNGDVLGGQSIDVCDESESGGIFRGNVGRVMQNSGAVLRASGVEDEFSSSRSSLSSWSTDDLYLFRGVDSNEDRTCYGITDGGSECCEYQWGKKERLGNILEKHSRVPMFGEFKNDSRSSNSARKLVQGEVEVNGTATRTMNKLKDRWFTKLHSLACMMSMNLKSDSVESNNLRQVLEMGTRRVRVRNYRRRLKELSALFLGQDFQAHEGSILAMRFSPDGQYLASAGEDKVVRVWRVVEDERSDPFDIAEVDPSCVYFSVSHLSELGPITVENNSVNKSKNLKETTDSACVIFPPKVFKILERPLHVFQGHQGEILDLSWSKNDHLLSSSVDKTVRLWRIGVDQCLKVFSHSDYVTCIQFNPMNDDYFISGSIDGKLRIWGVNGCHVVDWAETKDIITAVSYHPGGQSGVIGSLTGCCQFFNISDNRLQLEAQIWLGGKKKSPCKRITGFQFLPQDPSKLLVTCADSQVRILDGIDVIIKYKGLRNAGNQISASFTSDGKHIVSASEDAQIYIWNYSGPDTSTFLQLKSIRSFESFPTDASIVIPWSGMKKGSLDGQLQSRKPEGSVNSLPFSPSTCFSLGHESFLESNPKGSATWPEEKLPTTIPHAVPSPMCKSQYKLLKTSCHCSSTSHAWGLVLVTASWDGKIKCFHNYGLPAPR